MKVCCNAAFVRLYYYADTRCQQLLAANPGEQFTQGCAKHTANTAAPQHKAWFYTECTVLSPICPPMRSFGSTGGGGSSMEVGGYTTAAVEEGSSGTVVLIICGGIGGVVILGLLGLLVPPVSVCIRPYPPVSACIRLRNEDLFCCS